MKFLRVLVSVLAAAALAACGDSASVNEVGGGGDGDGSLKVTVHNADSSDVQSIWVSLRTADPLEARNLELSKDGGGLWGGNFKNIAIGTYEAQAWAFDHDNVNHAIDDGYAGADHDFTTESGLLFRSFPVNVTIVRLGTAQVHFILHQETQDGGDFTAPHITTVFFDKQDVEQWETVGITVTAAANPVNLTGLGRNELAGANGWFVDDVAANLPALWWDSDVIATVEGNLAGRFDNDAAFSGSTASLIWAPEPQLTAGLQKIVLEVDDGNGNSTRIAFDIMVGGYAAQFSTAFNHSPEVEVSDVVSSIENGSSTVTFNVNVTDLNTAEVTHTRMSYVVTSDCGGAFTSHGNAGSASGDFTALVSAESTQAFAYTSTTPAADCEFAITVTNWVMDGEDAAEDSVGASTTYKLFLNDWAWVDFTF